MNGDRPDLGEENGEGGTRKKEINSARRGRENGKCIKYAQKKKININPQSVEAEASAPRKPNRQHLDQGAIGAIHRCDRRRENRPSGGSSTPELQITSKRVVSKKARPDKGSVA